jgi:hypothetical protein
VLISDVYFVRNLSERYFREKEKPPNFFDGI